MSRDRAFPSRSECLLTSSPTSPTSVFCLDCSSFLAGYSSRSLCERHSLPKLTSGPIGSVPTMVLFETRGLRLSSVIRGGIECQWRLCAEAHDRLAWKWILTLEPSAPETFSATREAKNRLHGRSVLGTLRPAALDGPHQTLLPASRQLK